jgi:opacity protein-like surface antigen
MNKHLLMRCVAAVAICSGVARAQVAGQNFDFSLLWATDGMSSQTVPDSNVRINYSRNFSCCSFELGYQFARTSAGSLWFEFAYIEQGGSLNANIPSSGNRDLDAWTVGLRYAIPVTARLSFFGAAGGGDGEFHYPWILESSTPFLLSHSTTHGVFQWGGGVDVRISKRVSIRGEVRDLITGKGLSGSDGIHHLITLVGVGFHF